MLEALKFVKGAIAKKSLVPELSHFKIRNGVITSYNGMLSLCSPIPIDLEAAPQAVPFVKAIEACTDTVSLHMTKANRLAIKSGNFKAFIECLDNNDVIELGPAGDYLSVGGEFIHAVRKLYPFIAEDASRQWARGILFKGQSLFATNNVCIVEHWLPFVFPVEANVPQEAIRELLRINEEPIGLQISDNSITFHFENNRWMSTQVYTTAWPDIAAILNREANAQVPPAGFFDALDKLMPFADDMCRAYLFPDRIATSPEEKTGSSVAIGAVAKDCVFSMKQLLRLGSIVKKIDLSLYPTPCIFYGDNIRGAIVGMAS